MTTVMFRALGFAVPTVVFVTWLHLAEQASVGEAIDGFGSGLWFTLTFLAGRWLRGRIEPTVSADDVRAAWGESLMGALGAVLAWGGLWLFWKFAPADVVTGLGALYFVFNSIVVAAVGLALPPIGEKRWLST